LKQARNFGTTVPLWDQILGTYRAPEPVLHVGVANAGAYPAATDLLALLRLPFARRSIVGSQGVLPAAACPNENAPP
jgi:hypothetical protein